MDNLTNDNLDDLFREGSEQVDFPFREDAWAAMDEMLEQQEKKRRFGWIFLSGLFLLVFAAGIGLYAYIDNTGKLNAQNTNLEIKEQLAEGQKAVQDNTERASTGVTNPQEEKSPAQQVEVIPENLSSKVIASAARSASKVPAIKASKEVPATFTASTQAKVPQSVKQTKVAEPKARTETSLTLTENSLPPIVAEEEQEVTEEETAGTAPSEQEPEAFTSVGETKEAVPEVISAPDLSVSSKEEKNTLPQEVQEELAAEDEEEKTKRKKVYFNLYGSPEVNAAAGISNSPKVGLRLGFRFDYLLSEKLTVGAGLAFGRRNYVTEGKNYNAKPGFWVDGIAPTTVEANMRITEIPIEFRYYTKGSRENGFFFGAGVNSYLFSAEEYAFAYNPDDQPEEAIMMWCEDWTNLDLFGVGTLTLGYQRKLPDNSMLRIAPYYHLPLTGLGHGAMNMHSAGLQIEIGFK